ncbi:MAG: CsbD family protein [Acidobacteriaceae bacterium]
MNNEHVKGAAEKGEGKIKEAAGQVTGNKKLENEGKADQVKGAVHNKAGDAKDAVKQTFKKN